jgi:hypothetical protein
MAVMTGLAGTVSGFGLASLSGTCSTGSVIYQSPSSSFVGSLHAGLQTYGDQVHPLQPRDYNSESFFTSRFAAGGIGGPPGISYVHPFHSISKLVSSDASIPASQSNSRGQGSDVTAGGESGQSTRTQPSFDGYQISQLPVTNAYSGGSYSSTSGGRLAAGNETVHYQPQQEQQQQIHQPVSGSSMSSTHHQLNIVHQQPGTGQMISQSHQLDSTSDSVSTAEALYQLFRGVEGTTSSGFIRA